MPSPARFTSSTIALTIGIAARPGSVTKSGRVMPFALQ